MAKTLASNQSIGIQRRTLTDAQCSKLFMIPTIVVLIMLTIFPLVYSLVISFFNWNLLSNSPMEFIAFDNYVDIFTDPTYQKALGITFVYTGASVFFEIILGVMLALLAYQGAFGTRILRTVVISAMVISPVVVGTAWRLMYNEGYGLINYILDQVGIGGYPFLSDNKTVLPAIILADIWEWTPLVFVIVLAGLQGVSTDILEAASADGANAWQKFWKIIIPCIAPSIVFALLLRIMESFKSYDLIYTMTGGGPGTASQNINVLMYKTAFRYYDLSLTAAMAVISLIIVNIIAGFLLKLNAKVAK